MIQLRSFLPQEVCQACDGCCRYAQRDSVWAPLFLFEEIVELTEKNIVPSCLFTHARFRPGGPARIDLIENDGQFFCSCFDREAKKCKIYPHRPFDCQLYPFLLARKGQEAFLAVDKNCPYIQKTLTAQATKAHAQYLSDVFSSREFQAQVKNNSEIFQEYPQDLKILFALPFEIS